MSERKGGNLSQNHCKEVLHAEDTEKDLEDTAQSTEPGVV